MHGERCRQAWSAVAGEADAFLVTSPANVRYLTGFTGSNGCVLLDEREAVLGTDGRYVVQAGEECPGLALHIDRDTVASLVERWARERGGTLAVEADHLTVSAYERITAILGTHPPRLPPVNANSATPYGRLREANGEGVLGTQGIVEALRIVKDAREAELLAAACRISDEALATILPRVRAGLTEREVARMLESAMWDLGADGISFETIVAAGPHSAIPHHRPSSRPLQPGDLVVIDFGAEVGGYHADQTRTAVMGEPAAWQIDLHAVVLEAQGAGRDAVRAGADLVAVDGAARDVVAAAGLGPEFAHGLGHGVGLEIHEAPMIGPRATGILAAGSIVTVEPGVYLPDRGGVRIEDTVAVTEGPCTALTATDRGLRVLG